MNWTTAPSPTPILLNVSNQAGYGVEWMMPGTGGTTMQLCNPRGTHYLLFSLLASSSADWLTMGVVAPHRFGIHGPTTHFDEFVPIAHRFIAALNQTTGQPDNDEHCVPRIPQPRDPNESYRRQRSEGELRGTLRSQLSRLRPSRRSGRHRLRRGRTRQHRPTAPLPRTVLAASAA